MGRALPGMRGTELRAQSTGRRTRPRGARARTSEASAARPGRSPVPDRRGALDQGVPSSDTPHSGHRRSRIRTSYSPVRITWCGVSSPSWIVPTARTRRAKANLGNDDLMWAHRGLTHASIASNVLPRVGGIREPTGHEHSASAERHEPSSWRGFACPRVLWRSYSSPRSRIVRPGAARQARHGNWIERSSAPVN